MTDCGADRCNETCGTAPVSALQVFWTTLAWSLNEEGWAAALLIEGEQQLLTNTNFNARFGGVPPPAERLRWQPCSGEGGPLPEVVSLWSLASQSVVVAGADGLHQSGWVAITLPESLVEAASATLLLAPLSDSFLAKGVLRQALEQAAAAVLITDIHGQIVYVNRRFCQITGYEFGEVIGHNPRILQSGRTPRRVYQELWSRLKAGESWEGRVLNRRRDGKHYWSFQTISPLLSDQRQPMGFLSLSHDTTEFHEDYLALHRLAYYDTLCEIANRRALQNHLETLLDTANYFGGQCVALLFVNLDNFKLINDGYGHEAGDAVLKEVVERISAHNYLKGFLARLGGDEFALVVHGRIDELSLLNFSESLLVEVTRPIIIDEQPISVSASVGIAMAPDHAESPSHLMKCADTATCIAKKSGRNRSLVFRGHMLQLEDARIAERGVLMRALNENELFPVFQSVVSCAERGVAYYESLVRWRHPELGLLSPAVFLPAYQRFGLLTRLNDWMLEHACRKFVELDSQAHLSLNIAATDLMLDEYAERVLQRLSDYRIEPSRVRLEITEGELIENFSACEKAIACLRGHGVRFYIDDFGVGYASLAYLKRLPVDGIKLDRSFLQDFPGDPQAVDIIASVVALAHRLGLEVTAEGVEEMEQAQLLAELGCDYLQGFLFGKPNLSDKLLKRYL